MRITSTVLVGALAIACLLVAGGCSDEQIRLEARRAWIAKTVSRLREFKPTPQTPRPTRGFDELTGHVTYTLPREGLIPIGKSGWLYVAAHSMHEADGVGDVILAIDHTGKLYRNKGHVCKQLVLRSGSDKAFRSIEGLLTTMVEPSGWWHDLYVEDLMYDVTSDGHRRVQKRRSWIARTLARLRTFKPAEDTWRAERYVDKETGHVTYTLSSDGLVPIGTNGWIYIAAHSAHQEDGVGDAFLTLDHTGQLYANDGHVCQRMKFPTKSREGFRTVAELLEIKDQPNWAWRKLKE